MRIEIGDEERSLKEDETGDPDGSGSAQVGQQLFGRHGLDEEEQKRGQKNSAAKQQAWTDHHPTSGPTKSESDRATEFCRTRSSRFCVKGGCYHRQIDGEGGRAERGGVGAGCRSAERRV